MKHQTADGLGLLDETDKPIKTPWFLRFASEAILRQSGLAVLALTMLFGVPNAEAQLPTFEVYGIDTTYVKEYVGGQWHETETALNNVIIREIPQKEWLLTVLRLRVRTAFRIGMPARPFLWLSKSYEWLIPSGILTALILLRKIMISIAQKGNAIEMIGLGGEPILLPRDI